MIMNSCRIRHAESESVFTLSITRPKKNVFHLAQDQPLDDRAIWPLILE